MSVYFEVGDYKFEWDEEKYEINKKKHDVSFELAAEVFLDDYKIDDYDELHSDDEIDFSDIPPTTDEEFKRMFRANPKTPEQWEQFHKYCPLKHQERLKKMREALGQTISEPPEHLKNLVIW